jgi:hypothetical protein
LNHKIIAVQTDWGGEYERLNSFFCTIGISHRVSCPHAHQQNGAAKRRHCHIVEVGLALLADASMPLKYWDQGFLTATHLINRTPSKILDYDTPLHRLLGATPDYSTLRVFGCAYWPNLLPYNSYKLQFCSTRSDFLDYSNMHKGYKCLDISTCRVYISRDVVFDKNAFPFAALHSSAGARYSSEVLLLPKSQPSRDSSDLSNIACSPCISSPCPVVVSPPVLQPQIIPGGDCAQRPGMDLEVDPAPGYEAAAAALAPGPQRSHVADQVLHQNPAPPRGASSTAPILDSVLPLPVPPRGAPATAQASASAIVPLHAPCTRSQSGGAPATAQASASAIVPLQAPCTRSQSGIRKPRIYSDGTIRYGNLSICEEPSDLTMALSDPNWKVAMESEFSALTGNKTWYLVPPSTNRNIINCKCVFKIKHKADGTIDRYNARLVAKGFK